MVSVYLGLPETFFVQILVARLIRAKEYRCVVANGSYRLIIRKLDK